MGTKNTTCLDTRKGVPDVPEGNPDLKNLSACNVQFCMFTGGAAETINTGCWM
jgi:hypothetical protein